MDTDHNGKISETEEEAAFDRLLDKSQRFKERVDLNEDGQVAPEERKLALAKFRKRVRGPGSSASPAASPAESRK
jgi:hypothetical protein